MEPSNESYQRVLSHDAVYMMLCKVVVTVHTVYKVVKSDHSDSGTVSTFYGDVNTMRNLFNIIAKIHLSGVELTM